MSVLPALLASLVDGLGVECLVAAADLWGGVHGGVDVQVVVVVLVVILVALTLFQSKFVILSVRPCIRQSSDRDLKLESKRLASLSATVVLLPRKYNVPPYIGNIWKELQGDTSRCFKPPVDSDLKLCFSIRAI